MKTVICERRGSGSARDLQVGSALGALLLLTSEGGEGSLGAPRARSCLVLACPEAVQGWRRSAGSTLSRTSSCGWLEDAQFFSGGPSRPMGNSAVSEVRLWLV